MRSIRQRITRLLHRHRWYIATDLGGLGYRCYCDCGTRKDFWK